MMKVLYDYQGFQMQKFGGVSNSYAQLIASAKSLGLEALIGMRDTCNVHLIEQNLVPKQSFLQYFYRGVAKYTHLNYGQYQYNRARSIELLQKGNFDVFEPTFFDPYFLPYLNGKPFVTTIHDMTIERYAELHIADYQIEQKKVLCNHAAMLHCPSENTKNDMVEILGVDPERVLVIYHGAPTPIVADESIKTRFDFPYLLYVGDRKASYKNFVAFVKEYAKVARDYQEVRLICTGRPFTEQEQKLLAELKVADKVLQVFVSESELAGLYKYALAFVYPSLYEGFGMPILEAYTYCCPVMLTPYSCFPEIAGEAGVYFEMKDGKSDFYEKFKALYEMPCADRQTLIEAGSQRLKKYSWEDSARQLMEVYEGVVKENYKRGI